MKLRALLPWRTFTIGTRWPPDVAAAALRKSVDKDGWGPFGARGKAPFKQAGSNDAEFVFMRRIWYRNSFLPIIRVVIELAPHGGSRLRVCMRLQVAVILFLTVWMGGATTAAVVGLFVALMGRPSGLAAVPFALFGAGLVAFFFGIEAREAERILRAIYADSPEPSDAQGAYR